MRFEIPAFAQRVQTHVEVAVDRFGADVSQGSRMRLLGLGDPLELDIETVDGLSLTPRSVALRSALVRGDPNLVVQLTSERGVLAKARISTGSSVGAAFRNLARAIPSLCEQAAYCQTEGLFLPRNTVEPAQAVSARLASTRARLRAFSYRARLIPSARDWHIAVSSGSAEDIQGGDRQIEFHPLRLTFGATFLADPFVLLHEQRTLVFLEQVDRARGRGVIVATELRDNRLINPRVVLAGRHVAFPRVMFLAGRWICTAESLESPCPVYTCDEPGEPWRPLQDWCLPPGITDPVMVDGGAEGLTLYGTDRFLCSAGAVQCYQSDALGEPWKRAYTPFMYDVQAGRSGGYADADMRITQDCSSTYGLRLGITPTRGLDASLESKVPPNISLLGDPQVQGMHTLNWSPGSPLIMDTWQQRRDARALRWRWAERTTLRN